MTDEKLWNALPSVTVIVLNYNGIKYLQDCFGSLRQLIYPSDRLELMLVDNASTDGSIELMRHNFPEVTIVQNPENYGYGKGNNIGAAKARGEVIAFLNNDMRVDRLWLLELARPLVADKEIVASGSKILTWDGKKIDFAGGAMNFYGFGYQIGWGEKKSDEIILNSDEFMPILAPCGGAMLIRKKEFLKVGGFDEDFFAFYEDIDLGWRLWLLGYKVVLAPRSIAYHIHHGSWGKVPPEKRRVLYERNSLLTIIKNYSDANLQRVLPVALLLLIKRAYLSAGINDEMFRIGPIPKKLFLSSDKNKLITQQMADSLMLRPLRGHLVNRYLIRLWRKVAQAKWNEIFSEMQAMIRQSGTHIQRRILNWVLARFVKSRQLLVPNETLSYLVAVNDVIAIYAKMLKKRRFIQTHRKRTDEEIFALFRLPLEVSYFSEEYIATQRYLERLFGIDEMFKMPKGGQDYGQNRAERGS
ncbi:MAG: glycosyltransferase family 2 protein [Anaerolineae bacterium]|nr:glycosyltransferase family 2 protein [Anaerolineae bacterium]